MDAFILIQTEVGRAGDVLQQLGELPGISSADSVTGPYDVIIQADAADVQDLERKVLSTVEHTEGVLRTLTCFARLTS